MQKAESSMQKDRKGQRTAFCVLPTTYSSRGFTLLYAVLISSILLAIGIAIFEITVRELKLSSITRESGFAFFAADSGIECGLYWDMKYSGSYSAFPGSNSGGPGIPTSGITCNGQDIAANGTPPTPYQANTGTWTAWTYGTVGSVTTTTFTVSLLSGTRCAIVTVTKTALTADPSPPVSTVIEARGYNVSCGTIRTDPNAVEHALRASY
jgi:Tfp pilus assembly protein PilX